MSDYPPIGSWIVVLEAEERVPDGLPLVSRVCCHPGDEDGYANMVAVVAVMGDNLTLDKFDAELHKTPDWALGCEFVWVKRWATATPEEVAQVSLTRSEL